jgi:hypothetical protein
MVGGEKRRWGKNDEDLITAEKREERAVEEAVHAAYTYTPSIIR